VQISRIFTDLGAKYESKATCAQQFFAEVRDLEGVEFLEISSIKGASSALESTAAGTS
jgi:hypothetical protein